MSTERNFNAGERPAELPKTAVFGCGGFIGSYFLPFYRQLHPDCAGASRNPKGRNEFFLDLESPDISRMKLAETGHKQALLLAGVTNVAACETRKDYSRKINVTGTLELIRQLAAEGIKPIFASSDYIFDGVSGDYTDEAPASPTTEYGREKAEVEAEISGLTNGYFLTVRLSKIFGLKKNDGTLLDEMAQTLTEGKSMRAAYDQKFCPLFVGDLLKVVAGLQAAGTSGAVNACSAEKWSRYGLAAKLAAEMGVPPERVERVSLDAVLPGRPKDTSMRPERLLRETGLAFTPLADYLKAVAAAWAWNL
ncbi:MAG: hypothetical protein A2234_06570 [Elusimicrobia bacterium RIFOXYA2_FULL_58_8]|nr:MAG: hypothetical protein A2285_04105 [Elusimicrobia bacterium RIFOXYA12_FULL_57_11]OGS16153.1 MAG: hypothetical protein A2234_06570 [Elusimicrobia bacterium RIFOXYA2_FULL_58_8]